MNTPAEAQRRLEAANRVSSVTSKPTGAWSSAVLLERIDERTRDMQTQDKTASPLEQPGTRRRGKLVAIAVGLAVTILAVIVAVFALTGNDPTPGDVATPPVTADEILGTWQNFATDIVLDADGTYQIKANGGGAGPPELLGEGTYEVISGVVTFQSAAGPHICAGTTGSFNVEFGTDGRLTWTVIADPCEERALGIAGPFRRPPS